MRKSLLSLSLLLLNACAGAPVTSPAPAPRYQLTLSGNVDGIQYQGTAVGSSVSEHSITIESDVDVNYFTVQSCHRSLQFSDVIQSGWFKKNRAYAWVYKEAPTIEDTGDCLLRFCAFSKAVGSAPSSCAIVDFHSPKYTLPGENICNGADGNTSGTAMCHTQVGLLERFRFKVPVVVAPQVQDDKSGPYWIKDQCQGHFLDESQTLWEYSMPPRECVVIFMERDKPHRRAKLTAIPYDIAHYIGVN